MTYFYVIYMGRRYASELMPYGDAWIAAEQFKQANPSASVFIGDRPKSHFAFDGAIEDINANA